MNDKLRYTEANAVFKQLRDLGWIHPQVSRPKAVRAITRVLLLPASGDIELAESTYPYIPPLLKLGKKYNKTYLNQAFGTLKYLKGEYIGKGSNK